MKFARLCTVFFALAIAARADISPEKRQEIEKLLTVTGMTNLMDQMKGQMINSLRSTMPNVPADFWTKFEAKMDSGQLISKLIPVYDKYYTLEDLRAVNAFYQSPTGQKLLSTLPSVMQEGMQIGQKWGQEIAQAAAKEAEELKSKPE